MTQEELARQVGCSAITLRKLEAEQRRPSKQVAERLAELLQVPPDERPTFLSFARGNPFAAPATIKFADKPDRSEAQLHANTRFPHGYNLPLQLTSLIGREREIAEVRQLLLTARLVTLTGAGGSGKTRLALEVAGGLLDRMADGVWLVELAALADPTQVTQSVVAALGLRETPGRSVIDVLRDYLRPRQLLLLLDNCEHLVQACAELAETLLRACPRLTVLATSREALRIPGETVFLVPTLSSPDDSNGKSVKALAEYDAVRLFIDRARSALPDFSLTGANAPAVVQVCRQLDGIPLALELAAARLRMLPVEQLAARLEDAVRLLTGGSRTALTRHQTLQALLDWSYGLLASTEQTLLARLAVFAGGWTIEAAEAVCAGEGLEPQTVAEQLGRLIDKSLVMVSKQAGVARYRLLETIRQYAWAKLMASGQADQLRRGHAEYYVDPAWRGPALTAQGWLDQMEREHDNLLAAFGWSRSTLGQFELAVRLAIPLLNFWDSRGYYTYRNEARAWFERILAQPDTASQPAVRARAYWLVGRQLALQGDFRAAEPHLSESLRLFQELGDRPNTAQALYQLGWIARERGDADTACARLEQVLAANRELGDQLAICQVTMTLAEAVILQGNVSAAKAMLQDNLALAHRLGDSLAIGVTLNHLGHVAQLEGDYEQAIRLHEASLPMFEQLGRANGLYVWAHHDLGETALAQGDTRGAAQHFADALARSQELGDREALAWCLAGLAGVAMLDEEPESAARLWGAAETLRQSIGVREAPASRATHQRLMAVAKEQLGEAAFAASWAEGEKLRPEQAVELALQAETEA